jgi:carboxyl-terminal processing protease
MQSLVIDLRGNPGGLLTTAIQLSDKFLPNGTIVSTRGRTNEDNTQEIAHREQTWKTPLVVIVDENSASASEIFAAAIQENGRGLIVGRRSYGKGTVQTHFPLQTITGNLKITTARFFSPRGRVMADAGVTPDIAVPKTADDQTVVPLASDTDVREALRAAQGQKVRELAATAGQSNLISQR